MTKKDVRRSKFLSLALRHKPAAADVELDENGWTGVKELLKGCNRRLPASHGMTIEDLRRVVETNNKHRFEFDQTGLRIRARQGHSVRVELGYKPTEPPPILFHGTHPKALEAIRAGGLKPMQRHAVHLSADIETARSVGGRRGQPVVLEVNAEAMHAGGSVFYVTDNGVWLTDAVPPEFLRLA